MRPILACESDYPPTRVLSTGNCLRSCSLAMMIVGSLTLLPALLGWIGPRIENTSRAALIAVGLALIGVTSSTDA